MLDRVELECWKIRGSAQFECMNRLHSRSFITSCTNVHSVTDYCMSWVPFVVPNNNNNYKN